jgi:hypothetical protein
VGHIADVAGEAATAVIIEQAEGAYLGHDKIN